MPGVMTRRTWWAGVAVGLLLTALVAAGRHVRSASLSAPRFAGDSLLLPDGVERWVLAGASLGLGYGEPSGADIARADGALFHNVYLDSITPLEDQEMGNADRPQAPQQRSGGIRR